MGPPKRRLHQILKRKSACDTYQVIETFKISSHWSLIWLHGPNATKLPSYLPFLVFFARVLSRKAAGKSDHVLDARYSGYTVTARYPAVLRCADVKSRALSSFRRDVLLPYRRLRDYVAQRYQDRTMSPSQ